MATAKIHRVQADDRLSDAINEVHGLKRFDVRKAIPKKTKGRYEYHFASTSAILQRCPLFFS
jgi:hypothetical protein